MPKKKTEPEPHPDRQRNRQARREALRGQRSLEQVARAMQVTPRTIRRAELHGGAALYLCRDLARFYGCDMSVFL
ncbi:MAG TPA: hypothetical protein VNM48_06465 [Chloroflexota bacterium]|nr:hypothetical protein [Chloroflexota bacterium]